MTCAQPVVFSKCHRNDPQIAPDLVDLWLIYRPVGVQQHDSDQADQAVMWLNHILFRAQ